MARRDGRTIERTVGQVSGIPFGNARPLTGIVSSSRGTTNRQADDVDPLEEIRTRLAKYPDVRLVESSNSIEVQPVDDSGFPVTFYSTSAGYAVHFAGWHDEFTSAHDALDRFAFGLSEECRLRVVYHGATATKWIVESHANGAWIADSESGLLLVPFWERRREVLLQNRLIRRAS